MSDRGLVFADALVHASIVGGVVRLTLGAGRGAPAADAPDGVPPLPESGQLLVPLVAFPALVGQLAGVVWETEERLATARASPPASAASSAPPAAAETFRFGA